MNRRSFLLRSAGRCCRCTAPRRSRRATSKRGSPKPPRPRRRTSPCWCRSSWKGAGTRSRCSRRSRKPGTTNCDRRSASTKAKGVPFSEDETLMWHPEADGLAQLHAEGKVTVFPAIGYDPPDESHFTSRHYWEVGELDAQTRTGWMGRYLDVAGEPGNPLQGLSLDYSLAPALATAQRARRGGVLAVGLQLLGLRARRTADARRRSKRSASSARFAAPSPAFAQARTASLDTNIIRNQVAPFAEHEGKPGFTSPVTYPTSGGEFPQRLAALAAMLDDEALPIKCVSLNAVGSYDTHSDESTTLAHQPRRDGRIGGRLPARPRSAQTRRARADPAVVGVRPPTRGKRLGHRPRRGRGRVSDRQPREGQDGRRIPRPEQTRRKRKPRQHLGLPRHVRRAARSVVPDRSRPRDPWRRHAALRARAHTARSPS